MKPAAGRLKPWASEPAPTQHLRCVPAAARTGGPYRRRPLRIPQHLRCARAAARASRSVRCFGVLCFSLGPWGGAGLVSLTAYPEPFLAAQALSPGRVPVAGPGRPRRPAADVLPLPPDPGRG